jgi:acetyl-CoA C-acetyltransferase/acetyl-CoA acyltransferase
MKQRLAIVEGIRTPMAPAGKELRDWEADDLAVFPVREVLARTGISPEEFDEVIFGNVAQPSHAANIARVIALKAGFPDGVPAYTVARNCASGMQSVTDAAEKINSGAGSLYLVGGTESMSNIPFLMSDEMKSFFIRLKKSKNFLQKLKTLFGFKFRYLKPEIAVTQGLTDPVSGLIMGETAEVLARDYHITREEQDKFAIMSHERALAATEKGILQEEILPIPAEQGSEEMIEVDKGPREGQTLEKLGKLKPYFDPKNGTVTVGNSCPVTDGATALVVMSEKEAKRRGFEPLGFLKEYAYASLDPARMGLGPVYATAALLDKTRAKMSDFERIELNEAFAAQVIANEIVYPSAEFAREHLDRDKPVGELDRDIMNVNGGAVALGHPVGETGSRLVLTLLKELRRSNKNTGLATLCVGGGQGAALLLEVS